MPRRFKLILAYDGAPFAGWQSQAHGRTVQDHLEKAVRQITGENTRVHGAGRTDTGVHALGQSAHVDLETRRFQPPELLAALNAVLPPQIRLLSMRPVSPDFHARFSARGKVYRYRIWNDPILPPLEYGRVWHVPQRLDLVILQQAVKKFAGRHDFAAFSANRGKPEESTVRTIRAARLTTRGAQITAEFDGDGFLYRMVRMMVGGLILCGLGRMELSEIRERLKHPSAARKPPLAPAAGLYLIRVRY